MNAQDRQLFDSPTLLPILLFAAVAVYLIRQTSGAPGFLTELTLPGNDDGMRLLSVRDLLGGQAWFDTRQYRVLPPEGISLHWSRLIDAPLAGLLLILGLFMDTAQAERLLVLIWPMVLFAGFAWMTCHVTRRAFGVPAAVMALVSLWFLQAYQARYFPLGRLDHHNVQLILMLAVFGLLLSARRRDAGLAGVLAALSLAIGMETLPFMGLAGLVRIWRFLRGDPGAAETLAAFGLGLGIAAPLFFAAQTNPAEWGAIRCDQLSPPFLGLTTGAAGLSLAAFLAQRHLGSRWRRALFLAAVSAGVAALVLPGLTPCFGGPFADVPADVRDQVIARIGESAPAALVLRQAPAMAVVLLAPPLLVLLLAALIWLSRGARPGQPWGLLVLFLALGCAGAFLQLRAMIWGHAVMAVGFGAVTAHLINHRWVVPGPVKAVAIILILATAFVPQLLPISFHAAAALIRGQTQEPMRAGTVTIDAACNRAALLRQLDTLPRRVIMAPLNLGTGILVHSHHAVTAAPYHRDTRAMLNGVLPFTGDAQTLAGAVDDAGATDVLVCAGQVYDRPGAIGSQLAAGNVPDWLQRVPGVNEPLILYQVLPDRL